MPKCPSPVFLGCPCLLAVLIKALADGTWVRMVAEPDRVDLTTRHAATCFLEMNYLPSVIGLGVLKPAPRRWDGGPTWLVLWCCLNCTLTSATLPLVPRRGLPACLPFSSPWATWRRCHPLPGLLPDGFGPHPALLWTLLLSLPANNLVSSLRPLPRPDSWQYTGVIMGKERKQRKIFSPSWEEKKSAENFGVFSWV